MELIWYSGAEIRPNKCQQLWTSIVNSNRTHNSVVGRRMDGGWPPKVRTSSFAWTRHENDPMTFVFP
eukprot:scaffold1573_cov173-Amphora_coffeaeformis.AAC.6